MPPTAANRATLHYNYARALAHERRTLDALRELDAGVALAPEHAKLRATRADAHFALADFAAARDDWAALVADGRGHFAAVAAEPLAPAGAGGAGGEGGDGTHGAAWSAGLAKATAECEKTHYDVLGVARGADGAEIKQAYKKGCLRYHPDKQSAGSEEQRAVAKAMFARLADAHETLADAGKRRVYDFTLPRAGARRAGADSFTPGWGRRSSV